MTPAARLAAAASVLDSIAQGRQPAEAVLKAWGSANRYAGSKDRRAIADRVYKVLRARGRLSWIMGGREDGRALALAPASDPGAFGAAVAALAADPGRRRAIGAGGRALFDREFAWDRIVARLQAALGGPDGPRDGVGTRAREAGRT